MSYCRFSDGDVYLYRSVSGGWECCGCRLVGDFGSKNLRTKKAVLKHFEEHKAAGHKVPEYALDRIRSEMAPVESRNQRKDKER